MLWRQLRCYQAFLSPYKEVKFSESKLPTQMGIAESVELLSQAVAVHRSLSEWQRQAVAALCTMPRHLAERRLDLWERSVQDCWPDDDDDSEVTTLLWSVFELGRSNLYQLFDSSASYLALAEVEKGFKRASIPIPGDLDVSRW